MSASSLAVLDFGCDIGNAIPYPQNAFPAARLHGLDPFAERVGLAEKTHPIATFSVASGTATSLAEHSFDRVRAARVFHHVPHPQRLRWMREIRRVPKPGGHRFVFEHNVLNPLTVRAVHRSPVDQDTVFLPKRELLDRARRADFRRIHSRHIVFFPHALAGLRPWVPLMGWIPFGAQYVVHATA